MASRHIRFLVATSMLAAGVFAAEVRVGPEIPLTPPGELGPAALIQELPSVASNGREFLAVWIDHRGGGAALYASRIGTDGRPVERLGQRLATGSLSARVAAAGNDYLVVWSDDKGENLLRVDETGRAISAVRRLNATNEPRELVSNGTTCLLLDAEHKPGGNAPVRATILDSAGATLSVLGEWFGTLLWAGSYGGRYVIIDVPLGCMEGCQSAPQLHVFDGSGTFMSRVTLPFPTAPKTYFSAAASPDRVVITAHSFADGVPASFAVMDYSGVIVRPPTSIAAPARRSGAAWDGREFLLMFLNESRFAFRLSPDGVPIGDRFALNSWYVPRFASNGTTQLLVWDDARFSPSADIVARATESFAALAANPGEETLVSYSPAMQFGLVFAASRTALFGLVSDANGTLNGALNGVPLFITKEGRDSLYRWSAAAGKSNFLVVWMEGTWMFDLLAKRVAFDGRVLDAEPIVLASNLSTPLFPPAVAYDGSAFVVADSVGRLSITRVRDDGVVEERRSIAIDGSNIRWPVPMATRARLLTPYVFARRDEAGETRWSIGLDGATLIENATGGSEILRFAAATSGDRVTLAWIANDGQNGVIRLAQLTADGTLLSAPRRLVEISGPTYWQRSFDLVWNGSEYVLAWTETGGILRAIRLNRLAEAVDDGPFDIMTHDAWGVVSMVAWGSGVIIGYDQPDAANDNVYRAFTRTLDRLPVGRRPAVRH